MGLSPLSRILTRPLVSVPKVNARAAFSTQGGTASAGSLEEPSDSPLRTVYVHHVTKVVLQHLQETKSDWLVQQGLDTGLRLNSNGTAVLRFPPRKGFGSDRIW